MQKDRLDILLVDRGFVESRTIAQRMVMAGQVMVNGQMILKPSLQYNPDVEIQIISRPRFVSRGGEKLEAAYNKFNLNWEGCVCADIGASTGGFTDCLLQHGAERVYAIDVGRGILDWRLRNSSKVILLENTNVRFLENLPEPVEWITMDVSFISIKLVLPIFKKWFSERKVDIIVLIKPQFEAGKKEVARGKGVIKDPQIHQRVLLDVVTFCHDIGYGIQDIMPSPICGSKGNNEFLAWLKWPKLGEKDIEAQVNAMF